MRSFPIFLTITFKVIMLQIRYISIVQNYLPYLLHISWYASSAYFLVKLMVVTSNKDPGLLSCTIFNPFVNLVVNEGCADSATSRKLIVCPFEHLIFSKFKINKYFRYTILPGISSHTNCGWKAFSEWNKLYPDLAEHMGMGWLRFVPPSFCSYIDPIPTKRSRFCKTYRNVPTKF